MACGPRELLTREKESTRLRDQLSAKRRRLLWVKVVKPYVFEGPDGKAVKAREISYNRVSRPKEKGDTDESCKGYT